MVSFSSVNFDNVGMPKVGASPHELVIDTYNKFQETKDNFIAVTIANDTNKKERAGATMIGAVGGFLQFCVLAGVYTLAKRFPKLNFPLIDRFIVKSFDKSFEIARRTAPTHGRFYQATLALYSKSLTAIATGAGLGFLFDYYKTTKNTIINGKISNTTSGEEGSWIASGLKSMSSSNQGKEIIKNSIRKNDDKSVTVKFKGIDKEYTITRKELKRASRAYITYTNENGKVTKFKKKFSKGDGDTLAFEVAFEKYCNDVNNGIIPQDKYLAQTNKTISDNGDILFTDGSVNELYYLLTGKHGSHHDIESDSNDNIEQIYAKSSIDRFIQNYSQNPQNYSAEIRLKSNPKGRMILRDKYYALRNIDTDKNYTIVKMNAKYVTLADSEKTRDTVEIPVSRLKNYIASVSYVNY